MKLTYALLSTGLAITLSLSGYLSGTAAYAETVSAAGEMDSAQTLEQSDGVVDEDAGSDEELLSDAEDSATVDAENDAETDAEDDTDDTDDTDATSGATAESELSSFRYSSGSLRDDLINDFEMESNFSSARAMHNMPSSATAQGVDVSRYNGDIDWQQVKNAGIDFAIIKIGNVDCDEDDGWWTDPKAMYNISECERLGIPYGVYVYAWHTDVNQYVEGAKKVASLLEGHSPSLPVYLDLEDEIINPSTSSTTTDDLVAYSKAFCNTITSYGYKAGIYSSVSWYRDYLTDACYYNSGWSIWTAQYWYGSTYYTGEDLAPDAPSEGSYDLWQYSSLGTVPGISTDVDCNYLYEAMPLRQYEDVFDPDYYLENNPDVKAVYGSNKLGALDHFLSYGMCEGRRGNSIFDVQSYYNEYSDLRAAYGTDIKSYYMHYINYGKAEGRHGSGCSALVNPSTWYGGLDYSAVYDASYYLNSYSDLQRAFSKSYGDVVLTDCDALLRHFVNYGMSEGRQASASFDVASYYNAYVDLRSTFGSNLRSYYLHYIEYGRGEGRTTTGVASISSWEHVYGGVDYAPVYDGAYYCEKYSDLRAAFTVKTDFVSLVDDGALLRHFLSYGMSEGRQASASFDVASYYNANEDLRAAFGADLKSYYSHYATYGALEGRTTSGVTSLTSWQHSSGGVDYSPVYDGRYYYDSYADLRAAYVVRTDFVSLVDDGALLRHFLSYGAGEGRSANQTFNARSYYNEYPDLRVAYGKDWASYCRHYCLYGQWEGRHPSGCSSPVYGWFKIGSTYYEFNSSGDWVTTHYHNIEWAGQPNNYYCGPTSGYMVLRNVGAWTSAWGDSLTIYKVAQYMHTDSYGYTSFQDRWFSRGMNNWLGWDAYTSVHTPSYETVRDAVMASYVNGYATVVDEQERRGGPHCNGHSGTFAHLMVVDGYNQETDEVYIVDPGSTLWSASSNKFWYYSLRAFTENFLQNELYGDRERIGVHYARY